VLHETAVPSRARPSRNSSRARCKLDHDRDDACSRCTPTNRLVSRPMSQRPAAYAYEILSALPVPIYMHAIGTIRLSAISLFMAGSLRYATSGTDFLLGGTLAGRSPILRMATSCPRPSVPG